MRRHTACLGIVMSLLSVSTPALAKKHVVASDNALLSVHATGVDGSYAVRVFGHGPASSTIIVHIAGWISKDLPQIALGTHDGDETVVTDMAGNFDTNISLATDYWTGSMVAIDASVPDQNIHASTTYVIGSVSPSVHAKTDRIPGP